MGKRPLKYALLITTLFFVPFLGCSKSKPPPEQPTTEETRKPTKEVERWRWKGSRDTCFFVYKNECFDNQKAACAKAGCGEGKCKIVGGGPATIVCEK